jgi:ankyrin repeat protein
MDPAIRQLFVTASKTGCYRPLRKRYNVGDNKSWTLFHFAAYTCDLNICQLVSTLPIPPVPTKSTNSTPLTIAVKEGCIKTVRWFLDRGYDMNWFSPNGYNYLFCALKQNVLGITECDDNTVQLVKILLEYADGKAYLVNTRLFDTGETPMHYILSQATLDNGRIILDLMNLLIAHSPDPYETMNTRDKRLFLPIHTFFANPFTSTNPFTSINPPNSVYIDQITRLLLQYNGSIDSPNLKGMCTVHYATKFRSPYNLRRALDCNHKYINYPDNDGYTPFWHMMSFGNYRGAETMIEYAAVLGINLMVPRKGYTELPYECICRRAQVVHSPERCLQIAKVIEAYYGSVVKLDADCKQEQDILDIRFRMYFSRSFVSALLLCLQPKPTSAIDQ